MRCTADETLGDTGDDWPKTSILDLVYDKYLQHSISLESHSRSNNVTKVNTIHVVVSIDSTDLRWNNVTCSKIDFNFLEQLNQVSIETMMFDVVIRVTLMELIWIFSTFTQSSGH